ncbi:MAG: hypothetical protein MI976_02060 [Pseudomonadales bacterium]|nr:hypothetical protein [Pseudomonadales bacterium]
MKAKNEYVLLAKNRSQSSNAYLIGSIAGIVVGALFVIAGFILALLGFSGNTDLIVESTDLTAKLTNASPGVVFAFLGMIVLWRYKPRANETIQVDDNGFKQTTQMFSGAKELENPPSERPPIGDIVELRSEKIRRIIGVELNKSANSLFGKLELESITKFNAPNASLDDISDLAYLINLEFLNLESNNISDITPLSELKKLRVLSLNMNPLTESGVGLTPLSNLKNLDRLYLGKCGLQTKHLEPLKEITVNTCLSVVFNEIDDLNIFQEGNTLRPGSELLADCNPFNESAAALISGVLSLRGVKVSASSREAISETLEKGPPY